MQSENLIGNNNLQQNNKTIWIDLENSPHVPFFKPIIQDLELRGFKVLVTTRDAYQTRDLADFHRLNHKCIGKHSGKFKLLKMLGIIIRVFKLIIYVRKHRPVLAISHGSRSLIISSWIMKIKSIYIYDYEYTMNIPFINPTYRIIPTFLNGKIKSQNKNSTLTYNGIKEDVYVPSFKPQEKIIEQFGISEKKIIVTVRPPATEAHYHVDESEKLFLETLNFLLSKDNLVVILLPRSSKQYDFIKKEWGQQIMDARLIIPEGVVDGLELIWESDMIISGGGTMNREAAALGVPVYSIFLGKIGAVDAYLNKQGKLFFIKDLSDIQKINFEKRYKSSPSQIKNKVRDEIITYILQCL